VLVCKFALARVLVCKFFMLWLECWSVSLLIHHGATFCTFSLNFP
jgi:hypothetical protein